MQYVKTTAGHDALQQRSKLLSAKQRQLLFIIGTEAFDKLPEMNQRRLLQPELIDGLLALGFIEDQTTETETETETVAPVSPTVNVLSHVLERYAKPQAAPTLAEEIAQEQKEADFKLDTTPPPSLDLALNLPTMKNMMVETLQQYCGLLAKGLIERIRQCQTADELKRCHMAWVTLLQETRLPAKQLHSQMKQLQKFYHLPESVHSNH